MNTNSTTTNINPDASAGLYITGETTKYEIGSTIYTVTRKYRRDAKETLMDKLIRLIENDLD